LTAVIVLLIAGIVYLGYSLNQEKQANQDMMELAALEKTDMENEYQQFADQYSEMKTRINNDSIVAQLTKEQERTQQLLEELRKTKADDAAEITRLKKELATVRAVLRSYVLQIDSLNRLNEKLMTENDRVRSELEQSNQHNQELASSNMSLSQKVAIASQLNATNIAMTPLTKKGKNHK
jgi:chromosome segregation ATPase